MSGQHSPEPWHLSASKRYIRYGPNPPYGYNLADLEVFDGPEEEGEANRNLLLAAPDLLAAARAGGRYCNALKRHQDAGTVGAIEGTDELEELFRDWHDKTHAAIAKAEGRS